ncbi:MAG: DUF4864 domain-containing protein [Piscinibacter sp.]
MTSVLRSLLRALAALALAASFAAQAAPVSKAEAKRIRGVIQAQLDAFARDDARSAFAYAAPGIRKMFGTPERFLAMVREGYPVVYRPASVGFLAPEANGATVIQAVEMADRDGTLWVAVYQLERQRGGAWRITSCELMPSDGKVV